MKIVVTGAAGFIGSHLAERLVDLGYEVVGVDCFTPYYSRELKELNASDVEARGAKIDRLDLASDDLAGAVSGAEIVYHLAAQPGISSSTAFDTYLRNNVIATYRLLQAVKDLPSLKFFINISTSSIYGKFAEDTEDVSPKPTSYYGVTKLAAEQLVLAFNRDKGMPACSVRLFSVYGERERPEKLYPQLIRSILEPDFFLNLFEGSEKHERSYTYVGDIVDGLVSVLDHLEQCDGQIINLGCETVTTTGDNIKVVEEILGAQAKIVKKPRRPGDQEKTRANIQKAKTILGYNPHVLPPEGLKREALWYKGRVLGKVRDLSFSK